jgi:hypothetical protein
MRRRLAMVVEALLVTRNEKNSSVKEEGFNRRERKRRGRENATRNDFR